MRGKKNKKVTMELVVMLGIVTESSTFQVLAHNKEIGHQHWNKWSHMNSPVWVTPGQQTIWVLSESFYGLAFE